MIKIGGFLNAPITKKSIKSCEDAIKNISLSWKSKKIAERSCWRKSKAQITCSLETDKKQGKNQGA